MYFENYLLNEHHVILDHITGLSLTVKAATLIFISISFAKEGKSDFIYNLVNS